MFFREEKGAFAFVNTVLKPFENIIKIAGLDDRCLFQRASTGGSSSQSISLIPQKYTASQLINLQRDIKDVINEDLKNLIAALTSFMDSRNKIIAP